MKNKKNKRAESSDSELPQIPPEIFFNIGRILTSSLNPKEVFGGVMKVIGEYFPCRHWSLLLKEERTGRLKFEIVMGVDANKLKDFYLEQGEGIAGWVCQNCKPLVVEDVRNDPRFSPRVDSILDFTTRSVVCVPLLDDKNRVVGVIELINKLASPTVRSFRLRSTGETAPTYEAFTETDMAILSAIGSFTGIASANAFLHQKVTQLAMVDALTGTYNRHYFNEVFHREVERVKRYGQSICVLMTDVDEFKMINDRYGHLKGDEVLCAIAGILKSSARESDIVARFGGDEFIILMPMTDESSGQSLANRIQEAIDKWNEKPTIPGLRMGLSVAVHTAGPENVKDILLIADQKLYECKSLRKSHRK